MKRQIALSPHFLLSSQAVLLYCLPIFRPFIRCSSIYLQ